MARRNSVSKCICHDKTFDEIKEFADQQGLTSVGELKDRDYCSNSCGLCEPYVEIVLQTGQTEFTPGEPFRKNKK